MRNKKVTFDDIAKYTHFSKTTISRYFNNPDSLTVKNQKIIAQALIDLNYQENKLGKVLASGKTEFIGVIIPNLYFNYFSEMLTQLLATYKIYGYKFIVFEGDDSEERERQYIKELLAYNIEGLIVLSHTIPSKELADYDVPVVTIEREDKYVCSVNTDNYMGAVQATGLLIRNDCDILIHINSEVADDIPCAKRINGFIDLCEEYHQPYEIIYRDLSTHFEIANSLLETIVNDIQTRYPNQRKGIFMSNDTYANLLLNILFRKYGQFPEDYRLVGFDDSPIAKEAIVPFSTVGQQIDKIAKCAMELLALQINERKKRHPTPLESPIHKQITPVLQKRKTTD